MSTYTVADYLLDRLAESGVRHLFGVPGDFTLAFLDHVERHPLIEWVGCANELGAGYAADGYARMHGLGALSTTFGVGELSAISAVAGSYAEHVPVLHVVGAPTTAVQAAGRASHHSLGDGDFGHFARMTAEVTAAQEVLSATDATVQIDRVLTVVRHRRLPGYLLIPADVSEAPAEPPAAPLPAADVVTDPGVLARFRDAIAARLEVADSAAVLADILVARLGAESALHHVLAHGLPHASLLWGRRVVDETAPGYLGSYLGAASAPGVREGIENADLLVMAGVQFTDLTSGFFSQHIDPARTVDIRGEHARIGDDDFRPLAMSDALDAVAAVLETHRDRFRLDVTPSAPIPREPLEAGTPLSQSALWHEVAAFLRDGDTVLADQGTSFYGMAGERLPHGVVFGGQPLWAAIGFTLPAILGAALARPERRPVLLIGDGAAQLTIAELGTLVRHGIPAVIVVVDNAGYTVERVIHGLHEQYNDIATWDWTALLAAMDPTGTSTGVRVDTVGALSDALATARTATGLTLVQAVVPSDDVPPVLADLAAAAASANRRS
ncbi:alpha-keto acid decarboxylase family protein [Microbacterium trichothecenolyticum]|uniref:Alpha-keto-acid decarboxylase n=1 Tax=Microbacterium trichothecenolyticum TaxID=69370 RepID=A0ABU0TRH9_MICTR|nr:thiamine pyrophosphate-binding protein [Microbacterium trichothecenolyticum]MDQ1121564.1 TPP-dependent 2-oxoacid decarboxylase [Microbacterium trichothecenolyticum]